MNSVRREAAKKLLPSAKIYSGLDECLASSESLDALVVCTPPSYHADAVLQGLRAGVHVLCEKPLTLDLDSFNRIKAAVAGKPLCVYSVNNWAYSPHWSKFLEVVHSGRIGRVRDAEIRVDRTKPSVSALPGDWRKDPSVSGGGILVDHGWHNLYLMRRLLGVELDLVETVLHPAGPVDEVASLTLKTGAASGAIHLSWRAKTRSNTAFAMGDKGTASLEDGRLVVKAGGAEETIVFDEKLSAGSAHPAWLAAMWPAFEAERAGRGRGASLNEAEFCLKTIRRAYGAEAAARA
jgi:predicted dehydrogenase